MFDKDGVDVLWYQDPCGDQDIAVFTPVTRPTKLDGRIIDNIVRSARALAASIGEHLSIHHIKFVMKTQRLDGLSLWQKLTRILTRPAKVPHMSVVDY
ncbi:hypothetical protein P692DRAFT_20879244 [Suillus brevipes Sb2]|nr:hypothetical protein P692DRAFT_20879244 [Suillus brevipes Sb2]